MKSPLCYYNPALIETSSQRLKVDVCVYGGNSSGVMAAVQASRLGLRVVLLEPGGHLGGMAASGLSNTDIGSKDAIGGLAREYYRRCGEYYGVEEEWRTEPHVAESIFRSMLEETDTPVFFRQFVQEVEMEAGAITAIRLEGGMEVRASVFIDCSYEGDLMARAGVSCFVGRESNATYGETLNGTQVLDQHQFLHDVDPYIVPGVPESGLLPGVEPALRRSTGDGDHRIQAYNFRLCLTRERGNVLPFERPEGYDRAEYELMARYLEAGFPGPLCQITAKIRGLKFDMNNKGATSSDFIGRNYAYPEADYARREEIFQAHVTYQKGLMYFWAHDPRVPEAVQTMLDGMGLAADEFVETGGWPHQMYVREARRMVSEVVLTEQTCRGQSVADDPVGMAAYMMDSHNCSRFVNNGSVLNEGDVQVPVRPYGISARALRPRRSECTNLLVPVCLSASHIAYGSLRMEPVFMILGQSAATMATLAIEQGSPVQDVEYDDLRAQLERDGQVLELAPRELAFTG